MDKVQKGVVAGLVVLVSLYGAIYISVKAEEKEKRIKRNLAPGAFYIRRGDATVYNDDIKKDGQYETILKINLANSTQRYVIKKDEDRLSISYFDSLDKRVNHNAY